MIQGEASAARPAAEPSVRFFPKTLKKRSRVDGISAGLACPAVGRPGTPDASSLHQPFHEGPGVRRAHAPARPAPHGVTPWYSRRDIHTGDEWIARIEEGLKASEWFLVVLSASSAGSPWVEQELNWAIMHRRSRIIPVVVEHCPRWDDHFVLAQIQHADFTKDRESALANVLRRFGPAREATEGPGGVAPEEGRPKRKGQGRAPDAKGNRPKRMKSPRPRKLASPGRRSKPGQGREACHEKARFGWKKGCRKATIS